MNIEVRMPYLEKYGFLYNFIYDDDDDDDDPFVKEGKNPPEKDPGPARGFWGVQGPRGLLLKGFL